MRSESGPHATTADSMAQPLAVRRPPTELGEARCERAGGRPPGFALPVVLLGLAVLAVLSVAGFIGVMIETRVARTQSAGIRAFYAAESGIRLFLASSDPDAPTASVFGFGADTARVAATPLLAAPGTGRLFRITAHATHAPGGRLEASRTVSLVALRALPRPSFPAALAALAGVEVATAGEITGIDAAVGGDCPGAPAPPIAGLGVPAGGSPPGPGPAIAGNPAVLQAEAASLVPPTLLPWAETRAVLAADADLRGTPVEWPDFGALPADYSPVLVVGGTDPVLGAGQSGRGTLLAAGGLSLQDGFTWRGIVLAGGGLTMNGDVTIAGVAVAGLGALDGGTPGAAALGPGAVFRYDACAVAAALAGWYRALVPLRGSWYETM